MTDTEGGLYGVYCFQVDNDFLIPSDIGLII